MHHPPRPDASRQAKFLGHARKLNDGRRTRRGDVLHIMSSWKQEFSRHKEEESRRDVEQASCSGIGGVTGSNVVLQTGEGRNMENLSVSPSITTLRRHCRRSRHLPREYYYGTHEVSVCSMKVKPILQNNHL